MWLHDFRITRNFPDGVEERCERCHMLKFFRTDTPNADYLSWHLRATLQLNDSRFPFEFSKTLTEVKKVYEYYGIK